VARNLCDLLCEPTIARTEIDHIHVRLYAGCYTNASGIGPRGLP
jgi:hypothetical protein